MATTPRQSLLFLTSKAPWASAAPAACADVMMTAAIFDQDVSVVFCGDGVYQLLQRQDGDALGQKALAKLFPALELYDIDKVYVQASALQERGIRHEELVLDALPAGDEEIRALVRTSNAVFVF